jgi:hypothetical protein
MGPNDMTEARAQALLSMVRNAGCPQMHLTMNTLASWVDPQFPLHPLFNHLSAVHKCDYLRCYVLHVHGGGYADVKPTSKNWHPFFDQLEKSACYGIGYTEVHPQGVAAVGGDLEIELRENYTRLIGLCAMIFRPRTEFTTLWYEKLTGLIDSKADILAQHPARHPQDRLGAQFTDGSISEYPFVWTGVGGDLFHPLVYQFRDQIAHADMAPSFENYR